MAEAVGTDECDAASSLEEVASTEGPAERCFSLSHRSIYRFESEIPLVTAVAFLLPREVPGQRCDFAQVTSIPSLRGHAESRDDHGNRRSDFRVPGPLWQCRISLSARVYVQPAEAPEPAASRPWEEAGPDELACFLEPTELAPSSRSTLDYVGADFAPGRPRLEGALALAKRMASEIRFDMNATTPDTKAPEALRKRAGVCVDYVQIALSGLRQLGIPCRYTYGYRFGGHPQGRGADLPHAWLSIHDPTLGWIDLDPTTGEICDSRYITVAWGRDFAEVPPLALETEVEAKHRLKVQVDISERLDGDKRASA